MKIKNSKIIVAALSLSMILSACGNKDNSNDGSNGSKKMAKILRLIKKILI